MIPFKYPQGVQVRLLRGKHRGQRGEIENPVNRAPGSSVDRYCIRMRNAGPFDKRTIYMNEDGFAVLDFMYTVEANGKAWRMRLKEIVYQGYTVPMLVPEDLAEYIDQEGGEITEEVRMMLSVIYPDWSQWLIDGLDRMIVINHQTVNKSK